MVDYVNIATCVVLVLFVWYTTNRKAIKMSLNNPWFELVMMGDKKFEGRRYWKLTDHIEIGDTIKFNKYKATDGLSFDKVVVSVLRFSTFEEGLRYFNKYSILNKVLPGVTSVDEGVKIYLKFVSLETQLKDGVVFFEVE